MGDVDFTGRQWRGVFEPLADPAYFARAEVDIEAGTIAWPDGPDMAPEPLYAEARRHPARHALNRSAGRGSHNARYAPTRDLLSLRPLVDLAGKRTRRRDNVEVVAWGRGSRIP